MTANIVIHSPDLDAEELQQLTRGLLKTINQETDFEAGLPQVAAGEGEKGLGELFGQLNLTNLKSAIEPLFNALRIYFQRSDTIEMEFQCAGGKAAKLKINATDLGSKRVSETMRLTRKFLDDC